MTEIVEITWLDSQQLEGGGWMARSDVAAGLDDLKQTTVGYVLTENDTAVAVARSISAYEHPDVVERAEGVLVIPKACVVKRVALRAGSGARRARAGGPR